MTDEASASNGADTSVEIETSDGRKATFTGKRKINREYLFNKDGRWTGTRFDFRFEISDEYPENTLTFKRPGADVKVNYQGNEVHLLDLLAAHGAGQKLGDGGAASKESSIEDMFEGVHDVVENIEAGTWSERREASGMAGTSILLRALVEKGKSRGKTVADARALLKTLDQKTKFALRNDPELKPIVDRMEAERASKAAKVDTGKVLAGW